MIWQISGSSLSLFISLTVPACTYLRFRYMKNAQWDWYCYYSLIVIPLSLVAIVFCTMKTLAVVAGHAVVA